MITALPRSSHCPHLRPLWLVGLLSLATLGLYFPVWMGVTWSEMKRELHDERMHPFWHALSYFVPLYGLFRVHAHCAAVRAMLQVAESPRTVDPWEVLLGVMWQMGMVYLLIFYFAPNDPFKPLLWLSVGAASAVATAYVQAGLNAYWLAVAGRGPRTASPGWSGRRSRPASPSWAWSCTPRCNRSNTNSL